MRSGGQRPRGDDPRPRLRLRHRLRGPGTRLREILPRRRRNLAAGQRRRRRIEPGSADRGSPRGHSRFRYPRGRRYRFPHSLEDSMKSILVVEDEPAIATGLKDDLELDGYRVDVAEDGVAAMDAIARKPYDLVLLDVMLPKKDGFSVCRELRASGVRTPIILLTARGEEADKILGLNLGADDYVTKPFSPRELNARIQAVLRRGSPTGSVRTF